MEKGRQKFHFQYDGYANEYYVNAKPILWIPKVNYQSHTVPQGSNNGVYNSSS